MVGSQFGLHAFADRDCRQSQIGRLLDAHRKAPAPEEVESLRVDTLAQQIQLRQSPFSGSRRHRQPQVVLCAFGEGKRRHGSLQIVGIGDKARQAGDGSPRGVTFFDAPSSS